MVNRSNKQNFGKNGTGEYHLNTAIAILLKAFAILLKASQFLNPLCDFDNGVEGKEKWTLFTGQGRSPEVACSS